MSWIDLLPPSLISMIPVSTVAVRSHSSADKEEASRGQVKGYLSTDPLLVQISITLAVFVVPILDTNFHKVVDIVKLFLLSFDFCPANCPSQQPSLSFLSRRVVLF